MNSNDTRILNNLRKHLKDYDAVCDDCFYELKEV